MSGTIRCPNAPACFPAEPVGIMGARESFNRSILSTVAHLKADHRPEEDQ